MKKEMRAAAVLSAALCAWVAPAQQPQKTIIRNNFVSAYAPLNPQGPNFGSVSANRGTGPDGKPVSVISIDICNYHPDHEHRYCLYANGYAPPTVLTSTGTESVTVDVPDISILQGSVVDCRSGVCMGPLPIPAQPFRGIWKRYQGDFSFDFESAGITRNEGRFPDMTTTSVRTGIERNYSAEFQGSLGTTALATPGMFGATTINFSRSIQVEITRTPRR